MYYTLAQINFLIYTVTTFSFYVLLTQQFLFFKCLSLLVLWCMATESITKYWFTINFSPITLSVCPLNSRVLTIMQTCSHNEKRLAFMLILMMSWCHRPWGAAPTPEHNGVVCILPYLYLQQSKHINYEWQSIDICCSTLWVDSVRRRRSWRGTTSVYHRK